MDFCRSLKRLINDALALCVLLSRMKSSNRSSHMKLGMNYLVLIKDFLCCTSSVIYCNRMRFFVPGQNVTCVRVYAIFVSLLEVLD